MERFFDGLGRALRGLAVLIVILAFAIVATVIGFVLSRLDGCSN